MPSRLQVVTLLLLMLPCSSSAQEWTRFRGPNGSGLSHATTIPVSWTEDDYNWKIDLPGSGHASPVLWGERLFLFSADPDSSTRFLMCVDAVTGATHWKESIETATYDVRKQNSLASSTPAVDAEHVYIAYSTGETTTLQAFTHEGKPVWDYEVGPFNSRHGFATSPVVFGDVVVLNNQQMTSRGRRGEFGTGESFLLAVDCKTGERRWQTPRNSAIAAHSVPCIYQPADGPAELVYTSTAHGMTGIDPITGEEKWSLPEIFRQRCVGSPISAAGLVLAANGNGSGNNSLYAVKPGGTPATAYVVDRQVPYVPTPVAKDNLLFLWSDRGVVSCLDLTTGERHWQKRVGGNYFSSPVIAGDHLYCTDLDGVTVVLAAAKDYHLLAKNSLGDQCHATPAIALGRMYLRTFHHLISIGGPNSSP